jgi:hypothetical protein
MRASGIPDVRMEPFRGSPSTYLPFALAINVLPPRGQEDEAQWHRMSDTVDRLYGQMLADSLAFTWQILQEVDRS